MILDSQQLLRGQWSRIGRKLVAPVCLSFALLIPDQVSVFAANTLPTNGQFAAGSGTITTGSTNTTINQSSQKAIINWQSFSIGSGNAVQFNNGSGATLNRVTGNNLSQIMGSLSATGTIYLINPQGVVIGAHGVVTTGGSFVASTRDISDEAFMSNGNLQFSGTSNGRVINAGQITSNLGDVVLVGASVSNTGTITAPQGSADLVAGNDVLLQPASQANSGIYVSAGKGNVTNNGTIAATQVALAAANGNVYALTGNNGGVISATGTAMHNGHVWLSAGGNTTVTGTVNAQNADGSGGAITANAGPVNGKLNIAGTLNANAVAANKAGGTIIATASKIKLKSTAKLTANGASQGGTILIGGDRHGGTDASIKLVPQTVADANQTTVEEGAQISADATMNGNGGAIVLWSAKQTNDAAFLSAEGGSAGGNGGFAEVSSEGQLNFSGTVQLLAAKGNAGNLLLDPSNVTINGSTDGSDAYASGVYTPTLGATTSNILNSELVTELGLGNVQVVTTSSGGSLGTITVSNPIVWSSGNNLTLTASNAITVNANVTSTPSSGAGSITMTAGTGTGITIANNVTVSTTGTNGIITLQGDSLTFGGTGTAVTASGTGGSVVVMPATSTTPMSLVGASALNISQAELNQTTASTFTLGATTDMGAITVGGTVTVPNTISNLDLITNAASPGITIASTKSLTGSGTNILFEANGFNLSGTAGTISTGSGTGSLTIEPVTTAATAFTLTTSGISGSTFGLTGTTNDLSGITTGLLQFGSTSGTGAVAVSAAFAVPSNVSNLELVTNKTGAAVISITGALSITGSLILDATGAAPTITQSAAISATNLDLLGTAATYTLTTVTNAISKLAGNAGSVNLDDTSALTINTVNGTNGLTTSGNITLTDNTGPTLTSSTGLINAGGTLTITPLTTSSTMSVAGASTLNLSQASLTDITAATLILGGTGDTGAITVGAAVTVPTTINNFDLETNATSPGVTIASGNSLTTTGTNILIEANGVSLSGTSGTISTGSATGTVTIEPVLTAATAYTLTTTGASGMTFGTAAGGTNNLGGITTGTLQLGSTSGTGAITASGAFSVPSNITNLSLETNINSASAIVLTNAITVSGILLLDASGANPTVTQAAPITAGSLELLAGAGTFTLTNPLNNIGTVAGSTTGIITLNNSNNNLSIGSVNALNGVTAGTLNLIDTGTVSQTQSITVTNMSLQGPNGTYLLTQNNAVTKLSGNTGSVSLTDTSALTINTVNSVNNLTANGGIIITDNSAPILTNTTGLISSTGTVTLQPLLSTTNMSIAGSATFNLLQTSLNDITAANLIIGNVSDTGTITIGGSVTIPISVPSLTLETNAPSPGILIVSGNSLVEIGSAGSIIFEAQGVSISGNVGTVSTGTTGQITIEPVGTASTPIMLTGTGASGMTFGTAAGGTNNLGGFSTATLQLGSASATGAITVGAAFTVPSSVANLSLVTNASSPGITIPTGDSISDIGNNILLEAQGVSIDGSAATLTTGSGTGSVTIEPVSTEATAITLTSTGAVGMTFGTAVGGTNNLSGITTGTLQLGSINATGAVTVNSSFSLPSNIANLSLATGDTAASAINIAAPLSVGGILLLNAEGYGSTVTQSAAIVAGSLLVEDASSGTGTNFILTNVSNSIGTLAADLLGNLNLNNGSTNLTIGSIDSINGINANELDLTGTGTITQSQVIDVNNLSLQGSGATYTLTNNTNNISYFAANVGSGLINLANSSGLQIGTVNSINGVIAGSLYLNDAFTESQSEPVSVTNLLLQGTGGFSFASVANAVGTLAANTSGATVSLNNGANNLSIGTVNSVNGVTLSQLNLTDTGTVTETQTISATSASFQGVGGVYTLTGAANTISALAANTGTLTINDGSSPLTISTINAVVGVTASEFDLTDTGAVGQVQPVIATNASFQGTTNTYTLSSSFNNIGALAARFTTGTLTLSNGTNNLTIGAVNSINGVTAGTLNLTSTGTTSQTQAIAATNMSLQGANATYNLAGVANTIGTIAANVSGGTISFNNGASNLSITTVNSILGITTGTLNLTDTGTVSEVKGITATNLSLQGVGTYTLTYATNAISNIAASVGTGTVNLVNGATNIVIDTVNGINGITATNFYLTDTGTSTQTQAIAATNVEVGGVSATFNLASVANSISNFAASVAGGTVSLNNGSTNLALGAVNGVYGITAAGTANLTDTGTVTQSRTLTATNLSLSGAGGTYTLTTANAVSNLAGNTGTVTFNDSSALTINTVNGINGITTSGNLTITDNTAPTLTATTGFINSTGIVTITPQTATTTMSVAGSGSLNLTQASLSNITAGTLILGGTADTGAITVGAAVTIPTTIGNLNLETNATSPGITIASGNSLTASGGTNILLETQGVSISGTSGTISTGSGTGIVTIEPVTTAATAYTLTNAGASGMTFGTAAGGTNNLTGITTGTLQLGSTAGAGAITVSSAFNVPANVSNLVLETNYNGAGAINFSSALNITGNLILYIGGSSSTAIQTAAVTATSLDLLGFLGAYTLTNSSNNFGTLASSMTGTVNINNGSNNFSIGTVGSTAGLTAGNFYVTDTGTVTETQGVTATNASFQGAGAIYNLTGATNAVANLSASVGTGTVSLANGNKNLFIETLNGVNGIIAATFNLNDTGTTTQNRAIVATNASFQGAGGIFTLTTANTINNIAASITTGTLNLSNGATALSIGTVNSISGITAGTLDITDTSTTTQTQPIIATNMSLAGNAASTNFLLTNPSNAVGNLSASYNTGSISFNDGSTNLTIGTVNAVNGIAGGYFYLTDTGTVTNTQAITVTNVSLQGAGAIYNLTGAASSIANLAGNVTTGTISLNNGSKALIIGTVNSINGVTAGTFNLTDTAATTQTQALSVTNLSLQGAGGTYTLTNAANAVSTLAGNTGTISLTDTSAFTINTVNSINGLTSSGNITFTDNTAPAPTASTGLINASGVVTITPITLTTTMSVAGSGTLDLSQASLNDITASTLIVGGTTDTGAITVGGAVTIPTTIGALDLITNATTPGITIASGNSLTGTGTNIVFEAQGFNISGTTGTVSTGSGTGSVTYEPVTTGAQTYTLTTTGASGTTFGTVANGTNNLGGITTGTLQFGSVSGLSLITENAAFAVPSSITNLSLVTGRNSASAISFSNALSVTGTLTLWAPGLTATVVESAAAATITAASLDLLGSTASYSLTENNAISTLSGVIGALNFTDTSTVAINTVNGTSNLTTLGSLTITDDIAPTLNASTGQIIAANQVVTFAPRTASTTMSLAGSSTLNVSQAALNDITAGTFVLGSTTATGAITVGAAVTVPSNISNLQLITNASSPGITIASGNSLTGSGANILLEAQGVSIAGTSGVLSTGVGSGTVTIEPVTFASTPIILTTTGASGMTFGTAGSTNNLNAITTGTLQLGSAIEIGTITTANGAVTIPATISNVILTTSDGAVGAISFGSPFTLSGTLTLMPVGSSSTVEQSAPITVSNLFLSTLAPVTFNLTNSSNNISTLAVSAFNSTVLLNNGSNNLVLGTAAGYSGVDTFELDLTDTGTVTETQQIDSQNLSMQGVGGTYTLTGSNDIYGTVAANVGATGTISINDSGFVIGTVNGVNGITAGTLNLVQGDFTQTQPIIANNFSLYEMGGGTTDLTGATNTIGKLAVGGNPDFLLNNGSNNLSINTVNGISGISASEFYLTDTGVVTQAQPITTIYMALQGNGATDTFTNSGNAVQYLAANVGTGTIALNNGNTFLQISSVNGLVNITANELDLTDTNTVIQFVPIIASNLSLAGSGGVFTLTGATNAVGTLAANVGSGIVSLTNGSTNLSIGTVNSINGVTASELDIKDTGTVTQSQAIAASNLSLQGSTGAYTLSNNSNNIGTVAANIASLSLYDNASALTVGVVNSVNGIQTTGTTFINDQGTLTLNSGITAAGGGTTITLADQVFTNNDGTSALTPGSGGRFLVWSGSPVNDNRSGLAYNFKQYNATYGVTSVAQATGSGFLYTLAPTFTVSLAGPVTKTYDGTPAATLVSGNYSLSNSAVDGDTVNFSFPTSGTYNTSSVGTGKTVSVSGISIASVSNGTATVYGYQTNATASGAVETINAATLLVTADSGKTMVYGASSLPMLTDTITGYVNGENATSAGVTGSATLGTNATVYNGTPGSGSAVGSYTTTAAANNLAAPNYIFSYANTVGGLTVTPAVLTVTANNQSRAYGASNPSFTETVSGYANGDTSSVLSGSALGSSTASATTGVGSYTITGSAGSLTASNYTFTPVNGTLQIGAATLLVTADSGKTMVYGASSLPMLTDTITGYVNGENATSAGVTGSATLGTNATVYNGTPGSGSAVGSYTTTAAANNLAAPNYIFSYANTVGGLTVTPAVLTVTANNQSRAYGASNPSFTETVSGYANGDTSSVLSGSALGSSTASATTGVGSYTITGSAGSLTASNYTFTPVNGTLQIGAATLLVTADSGKTMVYGASSLPMLTDTITGYVNGENATSAGVTGSATLGTNATVYNGTPGSGSAVGSYTTTAAANNLAAPNYIFSYANTVGGLTVTPAVLTVTANNQSRAYGASNPSFTETVSGYANGDTSSVLSGSALGSSTASATTGVGSYTITGSAGSLTASNYTFTPVNGTLQIGAATLLVTADSGKTMVYGASSLPMLTDTITGYVNGENATSAGVTGSATLGTNATVYNGTPGSGSAVGSYTTTAAANNLAAPNYIFSYANTVGGLTVTPAVLTVTANNQSRAYGASNPSFTETVSGYANGDTSSVLSGSALGSSTASATTGVGSYTITGSAGSLTASNYTFTPVNGTLQIGAATLLVTADSGKTMVYGASSLPMLTDTITGYVNGENATSAGVTGSATLGTNATVYNGTPGSGSAVGSYTTTAAANNLAAPNYIFSYANTVGGLTVTPAVLTVTANNQSRAYGASNPSFTETVSGYANGDTSSVLSGSALGSSTASATTGVGSYTITGSAGSLTASNYTFTPVNGTLQIGAATLLVTADSGKTMVYGASSLPMLTDTITGYVNGENATSAGVTGSATLGTNATVYNGTPGSGSAVGSYTTTAAANNLAAPNYIFSYANTVGGLTVTPAVLTVTANNQSRAYGASNPSFTETVSGYANGDTSSVLSGSALGSSTASATTGVGSYTITGSAGSLTASNYTFTPVNGTLQIGAATLLVTADSGKTMVYGASSLPMLTDTITGYVNGENATSAGVTGSATLGTNATVYNGTPGSGSAVGSYTTTAAANNLAAPNYIFSYANTVGGLTVTPAVLTVTANNQSRAYGASNPSFTETVSGYANGDTSSVLSGSALGSSTASATTGVGSYTITGSAGSLTASNYTFTPVNGTLQIGAATLLVTADSGKTMVYGASSLPMLTDTITGYVNGENATSAGVTGSATLGTNATVYNGTPGSGSAVGSYTTTAAANNLAAPNYIFSYANTVGGLTVTPAVLTVTANNQSRAYGASNPSFTETVSGYANGDTSSVLSGSALGSSTASATTGVGSYTITGSAGSLTASNYTFTPVNGTLQIGAATLLVTADSGKTMVYGASSLPMLTDTITGYVNGENATSAGVTGSATLGTNATVYNGTPGSGSAVGSYTTTAAANNLAAPNYIFSYANTVGGLTVTPAVLTVTANNQSRAYGASNPSFTETVSGYANGDTSSVLSGSALGSSTASATTGVGSYTITGSAGSLTASNYTFTPVNGTLQIGAATLLVTADSGKTMVYGASSLPMLTDTITGYVNGENATSAGVTGSATLGTNATVYNGTPGSGSAVGSYTTTAAANNLAAPNYIFSYANTVGGLTVTPAVLTVTANNQSRAYGASNPSFTETVSGYANGDTSSVLSGSALGSSTASATTGVGSYTITGSAGSLTASNYTFTPVNGTLQIGAATLLVTADSGKTMVYGASSLPMLTDTITGYVNGENATSAGVTGSATLGTNATVYNGTPGSGSAVGSYTTTAAANNLAAPNYIFSYANTVGGLTVTPAVLTVTANNQSRAYGASNPSFTETVSGYANGDTSSVLSGSALGSSTASATTGVGSYTITGSAGSLTASNYTFTPVNGTLQIGAATLTVGLIGPVSKVYDGTTNATLTSANYTLGGIVNGDTITVNNTVGTYDTPNVGTNKTVTVAGLTIAGAAASNYQLASSTVAGAVGTIVAAGLNVLNVISFSVADKVYDGTTSALITSDTLNGVMAADIGKVDLNKTTDATFAAANVGNSIIVRITGTALTGSAAGNYYLSIVGLPTTTANINPIAISGGPTLTPDALSAEINIVNSLSPVLAPQPFDLNNNALGVLPSFIDFSTLQIPGSETLDEENIDGEEQTQANPWNDLPWAEITIPSSEYMTKHHKIITGLIIAEAH